MVDIAQNEAKLNITYGGQNGDLAGLVPVDATDAQIREWATEAVRAGDIAGLPPDPDVDLSDFVIDRFAPTDERPFSAIFLRPKTPFG